MQYQSNLKKALLASFLLVGVFSFAQKKAITETGDEVLLNEDGTWQYTQPVSIIKELETIENPTPFTKDASSNFLLKSKVLNIGFWLNPKEWSFGKPTDNPDAEYELTLKGGDLYGVIITEKIEIPLETLKTIALENGKVAAPDLKLVKSEYRMVNGKRVLLLQMDGTMQGIKFSYYGYYYSNKNGTVQLITFTAQNLLEEYAEVTNRLLNGMVEL